jgi:predicted CXXCH cytochrome family protein
MKIKYILEAIGPKGLRDRTEKNFEEIEVTLGRGSSCDILLASRLVSFNHAKVSIADDKLFLEELEGQRGTTLVNNQAVSKGSLVPGDTLKLGDVSLKIEFDSGVWSLIEVRSSEGQLDAKEQVNKQLGLLTVAKRVPSIYIWSLLSVIPILIFLLAAPIMGLNEPIWESGPMTRSHKFLQTDCRSCHEKNFEMVADKACKKCHDMGDHVEFLTKHSQFNEKCGDCHREHISEDALILSKSDLCLYCHANIQEVNVDSEYPAINGFNQSHPDFELVRTKKVDRAKLKLNHKYHLSSIEMDDPKTGKKRLMGCSDCHIPDVNGEYMDAITFDKYCASCHKLKMGGAAHMLKVPHVKTNLVRTFLKDPKDFLYEYIDSKPGDLMEAPKASGGRGRGRRSKGPPPAPVQKPRFDWVKNNIDKIEQRGGLLGSENEIFFSAQGGCVECHYLNVRPVGSLNADGSLAAISLWEHDVRLWDGKNGQDKAILQGHQDIVNSASFSSDGNQLVTASKDFTARVWGVFEVKEPEAIDGEVDEIPSIENAAEASVDPIQETLSSEEEIPLEPAGPEIIESTLIFKGHNGSVNDAVFSPDQSKILTGSEDGLTIVWDINTQKPIHKLQEFKESVNKVRFNSNGSLAVALNSNFNVSIWNVGSGDLKTILRTRKQQIVDVEFSPVNPSKIAAAFSEGSIRIYDLEEKSGLVKLSAGPETSGETSGHSLEVTAIVFSPDGSKIASISRDLTAKIWDANTGKVLSTLIVHDKKANNGKKKDQRFVSISFSGDSRKVVTGSSDKVVRLWDVSSGKLLKEFTGHENVVSLALFAKKADYLLTASDENLAMLWDLSAESKKSFRHGEAEDIKTKTMAAKNSENPDEADEVIDEPQSELRLPRVYPTNVPTRFFKKGFFSHRKHEYMECNNCHNDAKESILTSDLLLPSIKPCRTCHEKQGIQLDRCVVCHIYHPQGERNFMKGLLAPDHTAKLGYSYLRTRKENSTFSFFGKK